MSLSVTLNFNSVPAMLDFFARATGVVAPEDRPDAGAVVMDPPVPQPNPAQVFGAQLAAAVVPPSTAPAAPPVSLVVPTPPVPAAPTVSAAPAPTAPVAPSVSAPAVELDANGLPWDGRIHASTKTKNADGTWRGKRKVDDAEVARVTAELRGLPPAPPPAVISAAAAALPAQAVAATPPVPPTPTAARAITFGELMVKIQEPMVNGKLPRETLAALLTKHGCPEGITQLMHVPHLVPAVDAELSALLGLPVGVTA